MKTTIDLPLPLLKKAKKYARDHHMTLRALIELGLQHVFSKTNIRGDFKLEDKSVTGKGLHPGLDWENWSEIREIIYEGRGSKR